MLHKIAIVPSCYLGAMSQILQIHTRDQEIPITTKEMSDKVEVQVENEVEVQVDNEVGS